MWVYLSLFVCAQVLCFDKKIWYAVPKKKQFTASKWADTMWNRETDSDFNSNKDDDGDDDGDDDDDEAEAKRRMQWRKN